MSLPEADHWATVKRDGETRTVQGDKEYGTSNSDAGPLWLLDEGYTEWLDQGNYIFGWARKKLGRGPEGQERIFVSGPYSDPDPLIKDHNVDVARQAMGELLRGGHWPLCPHTMTYDFEWWFTDIPKEVYLNLCLAWLPLCHSILMLPGWEQSEGATAEHEAAKKLRLTIYYSLEDVPDLSQS